MNNFFQSQIRKHIKTIIYQEDSFNITLFDQEYFGIKKIKRFGPISLSWFQVLGVQIPHNNIQWINEQADKIHQDYSKHRSHLLFQWGVSNEILRFHNFSHRSKDFTQGMKNTRLQLENKIQQETGLVPSFRENMPLATIVIDVTKTDEELLKEMNSGAKKHVKKSLNRDMVFRVAEEKDYDKFYEERYNISKLKKFNIIKKETYKKLMDYLTQEKCGNIYMAEKDGIILGGSIAVYDQHSLTYLYGFSNRNKKYRNIGVHQFIKYKMFGRARSRGLQWMDLFGGAPTGFDKHPLTSVSKFKESLGGIKVERYGNYDIILNPYLYKIFKEYHKFKKR